MSVCVPIARLKLLNLAVVMLAVSEQLRPPATNSAARPVHVIESIRTRSIQQAAASSRSESAEQPATSVPSEPAAKRARSVQHAAASSRSESAEQPATLQHDFATRLRNYSQGRKLLDMVRVK